MSGWHGRRRARTYEIGQCSKMVLAMAIEIIARDIFSRDHTLNSPYGWNDPSNPELQDMAKRILFHADNGMQRDMRNEALLYAHGCMKVLREQFGVEERGLAKLPKHKEPR